MVHNRIPLTSLLCAVAGGVACTTVRPVQPAKFFAVNSPDVVWVTEANNAVVAVADAQITGDTLKGVRRGTQESLAIPLDQVRSVQAKVPDRTKTLILVTGALAGFGATVYALWISKAGDNTGGVDCGVDPDGHPYTYC